jgi:hypothetical protein
METYNRVRKVAGYYILENVIEEEDFQESFQAVAKFSMNFFNPVMVETICRQIGFPISTAKREDNTQKFSIPKDKV